MSWRKLLCSECNGPLEIDIDTIHNGQGYYLWCGRCQGGCDLATWLRWEVIESDCSHR